MSLLRNRTESFFQNTGESVDVMLLNRGIAVTAP